MQCPSPIAPHLRCLAYADADATVLQLQHGLHRHYSDALQYSRCGAGDICYNWNLVGSRSRVGQSQSAMDFTLHTYVLHVFFFIFSFVLFEFNAHAPIILKIGFQVVVWIIENCKFNSQMRTIHTVHQYAEKSLKISFLITFAKYFTRNHNYHARRQRRNIMLWYFAEHATPNEPPFWIFRVCVCDVLLCCLCIQFVHANTDWHAYQTERLAIHNSDTAMLLCHLEENRRIARIMKTIDW